MRAYELIFTREARTDLDGLPASVQKRVLRAAKLIAADPRRVGTCQLTGHPGLRRMHAGKDYVLLYTIQEERVVVLVLAVAHRRKIYRRL